MNLPLNFANELALKLRGKNPLTKDTESEHSKTPDSPTGIETGTSPSRNLFNDTRTPRSMSSLSHSSNSLLSGNTCNNYGTSDGESMSRSVIDSHDDIGIVVDLATPMCKTTTAALLDSTAARQKIAASKARRVRPKAIVNASTDKVAQSDNSGQFSPVRDKRDILEEISEEDCPITTVPGITEEPSAVINIDSQQEHNLVVNIQSSDAIVLPKVDVDQEQSSSDKMEIINSDVNSNPDSVIHPDETGDSSIVTSHNASTCSPLSSADESKSRGFNVNKAKFQFEHDNPVAAESKFPVKLRPTGINNLVNSSTKPNDLQVDTVNTGEHCDKSPTHKEDHVTDQSKVHRYSPLRPTKDFKTNLPTQFDHHSTPSEAIKTSHTAHNIMPGSQTNNRQSKVLNMLKNFEG